MGRKKWVRKAEPSKPPPEQRGQVEQKPRSRWQSIKKQVVRASEVAEGPLIAALVISMILLLWRDVIKVPVTSDPVLRGVLTGVGILIVIRIGYRYEWTGFGERAREKSETGESETGESQPRKTLWDWMTLLLIPVMIGIVAPWFNYLQDNSQRAIEARQRAQEAENRAQSAALQAYLGQMSQLLSEGGLRQSEEGDAVFTLAQARTTTTIKQLDGGRNQILTRFLSESGLLREPPLLAGVGLEGAELPQAVLQGANLAGTQLDSANLSQAVLTEADFSATEKVDGDTQIITADLTKANLSKAALQGADLSECLLEEATLTDATLQSADLRSAELQGADLSNAALKYANLSSTESIPNLQDAPLRLLKQAATNLADADLSNAALQNADLSSAVLQNANLTGANLTDADLSYAYLSGAEGISNEGLEQQAASLEGATMPNGQKYEDWLKDK